jgi:hypothetical protein
VHAEALLIELRDLAAAHGDRPTGPVARLSCYDAEHGTNLVETLRAWLGAFGDVAAAAMFVHPNTFRYRLRRLTEVSGIDLADPEQRFAAMRQLRAVYPAEGQRLLARRGGKSPHHLHTVRRCVTRDKLRLEADSGERFSKATVQVDRRYGRGATNDVVEFSKPTDHGERSTAPPTAADDFVPCRCGLRGRRDPDPPRMAVPLAGMGPREG